MLRETRLANPTEDRDFAIIHETKYDCSAKTASWCSVKGMPIYFKILMLCLKGEMIKTRRQYLAKVHFHVLKIEYESNAYILSQTQTH